MSIIHAFCLVGCLATTVFGQSQPDTTKPPCSAPAASQFDFWVGEWQLSWADSGRGTNIITKPFGSCVIQEQFRDLAPNSLVGLSVSVYDGATEQWQQTWVDNQGGYMVFTGGFADKKMILSRETTRPDGTPVTQRMVFRDITAESLIWDWEASTDGGKSWNTNWQIRYQRVK